MARHLLSTVSEPSLVAQRYIAVVRNATLEFGRGRPTSSRALAGAGGRWMGRRALAGAGWGGGRWMGRRGWREVASATCTAKRHRGSGAGGGAISYPADGGGALATSSSPAPCTTSTAGRGAIVESSGRGEPPAPHDEVGGGENAARTAHGHGYSPSRAVPTWANGASPQRFLLLSEHDTGLASGGRLRFPADRASPMGCRAPGAGRPFGDGRRRGEGLADGELVDAADA